MGNCCKSKEKINEQLKSDALSKISEFYLKMEYPYREIDVMIFNYRMTKNLKGIQYIILIYITWLNGYFK